MPSTISSPVDGMGSLATVSATASASSLSELHVNQQLLKNGLYRKGYLSETFLSFFAGVLPDAAATSAIPLLDLTPNAASKVVCTTVRGGMVVEGELSPWCACDSPCAT